MIYRDKNIHLSCLFKIERQSHCQVGDACMLIGETFRSPFLDYDIDYRH